MYRLTGCFAVLVVLAGVGQVWASPLDVSVFVAPPFSDPPVSVSSGYSAEYVPLDSINLTEPSGHPQPDSNRAGDNQWGVSLDYGSTGRACMVSEHEHENSPEVAWTIGGLSDSPYDVFAQVMVNSASDVYGGRFGLSSGSLTPYFASSGGELLANGRMGKPGQGRYQIREFHLGTEHPTGGALTVFMDDFDGVRQVATFSALRLHEVPEPSTFTLLAMSAVGLLLGGSRLRHLWGATPYREEK